CEKLFGSETARAGTQFGDARLGVEIGPVGQREIGHAARIVGPVGDAELLAGDVDGAQPAAVLQDADIGERRAVDRDEIGGAAWAFFRLATPSRYRRSVTSTRPFCAAGSCGWVKSIRFLGCVSVGQRKLPLFSIAAMHSSSRSKPWKIRSTPARAAYSVASRPT